MSVRLSVSTTFFKVLPSVMLIVALTWISAKAEDVSASRVGSGTVRSAGNSPRLQNPLVVMASWKIASPYSISVGPSERPGGNLT